MLPPMIAWTAKPGGQRRIRRLAYGSKYGNEFGCRSLSLALSSLSDEQVLVDVGNNTSAGNGGLDEKVELLVSADGQLQVARSDPAHLEVLRSVARQFQDLSSEVLQDRRRVDCSGGADSVLRRDSALQETVDPAHGELESCPGGFGLGGPLGLADLASLAAFASLASLACHSMIINRPLVFLFKFKLSQCVF